MGLCFWAQVENFNAVETARVPIMTFDFDKVPSEPARAHGLVVVGCPVEMNHPHHASACLRPLGSAAVVFVA